MQVFILGQHQACCILMLAFLLDRLSVTMVMIVLFVSFMVHIYTIGYMADDPGYQRFFSYVSLFTFAC